MSQETVEVVRTVLDVFTRRDHEAVFGFYDRDIEWDASRPGGCNGVDTAGIYHGHNGVRAYSGIALNAPPFAIGFTLHNRKIVRWVFYPNQAEALEAAGLSE
jgi:hypothetical protein